MAVGNDWASYVVLRTRGARHHLAGRATANLVIVLHITVRKADSCTRT